MLTPMRGFLRKMISVHHDPIDYYLHLDDQELHLNPYIGTRVKLAYTGLIQCLNCARATSKSYSQGYCYPCFKRLAQCDLCVMSPERCHYHKGTCRDEKFALGFCMQPHIVYIANSSGIKVGITKQENLPTRWIDQGAVQALPIVSVASRMQSGLVEVAFKNHISDKTQWQRMLKADDPQVDMLAIRDQLMLDVNEALMALTARFGLQDIQPITETQVQTFRYPVNQYPTKVVSMNFDKTPEIQGNLFGIKGQYLIFDIGVINLRKFTAYEIEFSPLAGQTNATSQLQLL